MWRNTPHRICIRGDLTKDTELRQADHKTRPCPIPSRCLAHRDTANAFAYACNCLPFRCVVPRCPTASTSAHPLSSKLLPGSVGRFAAEALRAVLSPSHQPFLFIRSGPFSLLVYPLGTPRHHVLLAAQPSVRCTLSDYAYQHV